MLVVQVLAAAVGAVLVATVLASALTTVVVPRGYASWLTRRHFRAWRWVFGRFARDSRSYEERDRTLSHYAPVALITLPAVWVAIVTVGFTGIFWGSGVHPLSRAFAISGSSLLTLGFDHPPGTARTALSFVEAGIGLGMVSLMISYLPTIYAAFSRREALVAMLEGRAGLPPSPAELIVRYTRIGWIDRMHDDVFYRWEPWFVDVEESHTSHPSLAFFRSPHPERSWITAAGCVLDTASITASTLDMPRDARAEVMIRTGFFALRRIADYFGIEYPADPAATDPISVTKDEYLAMCATLAEAGVPLKADLEQGWRDFQGWRVNYDAVLVGLCDLVQAPPGVWSTDRLPVKR